MSGTPTPRKLRVASSMMTTARSTAMTTKMGGIAFGRRCFKRSLRSRASIVCWEGVLRIVAFFLLAGYGFFGGLGISMALVGTVDLVIGLIYLFGLPRSLGVKGAQLLLDSA